MFGFMKRKEQRTEIVQQPEKPEEILGLREYISVDSMKAHLVDILEENRRLKEQNEEIRRREGENRTQDRKKYELATVQADEYRKREKEAKDEIAKRDKEIDRLNNQIEKLQKERNTLITEKEMAEDKLQKEMQKMRDKEDCSAWLRKELEGYGNWEKVTKTQLVEILKRALEK